MDTMYRYIILTSCIYSFNTDYISPLSFHRYVYTYIIASLFSTMPKTKKAATAKSSKKQKLEVPELTKDEKKIVLIQYGKENDLEGAEDLLAEYLKFMQIKIGQQDTTDKKCAPSKKIDEMWHGT